MPSVLELRNFFSNECHYNQYDIMPNAGNLLTRDDAANSARQVRAELDQEDLFYGNLTEAKMVQCNFGVESNNLASSS